MTTTFGGNNNNFKFSCCCCCFCCMSFSMWRHRSTYPPKTKCLKKKKTSKESKAHRLSHSDSNARFVKVSKESKTIFKGFLYFDVFQNYVNPKSLRQRREDKKTNLHGLPVEEKKKDEKKKESLIVSSHKMSTNRVSL